MIRTELVRVIKEGLPERLWVEWGGVIRNMRLRPLQLIAEIIGGKKRR